MENLIKCPFCGSDKVGIMPAPNQSDKFYLAGINTETGIVTNHGISVDLISCTHCGSAWLFNKNFKIS